MKKEEVIDLLNNYEGTITINDNVIEIVNANIFTISKNEYDEHLGNVEWVVKQKRINTHFIFDFEKDNFSGWEDSYETKGGFGFPALSQIKKESVVAMLENFNFARKQYEQLNLF